jgi:hypothetical protein
MALTQLPARIMSNGWMRVVPAVTSGTSKMMIAGLML